MKIKAFHAPGIDWQLCLQATKSVMWGVVAASLHNGCVVLHGLVCMLS